MAAWINYYEHDTKHARIKHDIPGRWWDISEVLPNENPQDKERVNIIANGQPVKLALAIKRFDDSEIYAYNNSSHRFIDPHTGMRHDSFKLGDKQYEVKVILSGIGLSNPDPEFWFLLSTDKDKHLIVNKIQEPDWSKNERKNQKSNKKYNP